MSRFASTLALFFFTASGCALPLDDAAQSAKNNCSTNADCGTGAVCIDSPVGKSCAATQTNLDGVILEVRPTPDKNGSTVSNVFVGALAPLAQGHFDDGALLNVDLAIPSQVAFTGQLVSGIDDAPGCKGPDGSIATSVELHASSPYLELRSTYKGKAVDDGSGNLAYALKVPSGTYDAYFAPIAADGCESLPPRLVSGVEVNSNVMFTQPSDDFVHLQGDLTIPANPNDPTKPADVQGWTIEVVDPDYGLVISDTQVLSGEVREGESGQIQPADAAHHDSFYVALKGPEKDIGGEPPGLRYYYRSSAVVRIRDASGKLLVHWALTDAERVDLNLADLLSSPTHVDASVIDASFAPVPSSVRFESMSLTGGASQNASYRIDTDTNAAGEFEADLVPGLYRVTFSPHDQTADWAPLVEEWDLKGSNRAFQLPGRPTVGGQVFSPGRKALPSLPVVASPTSGTAKYFSPTESPSTSIRQSLTQTNETGNFSMLVDPGTVDFSVQPEAGSGFPWLVVPSLLVNDFDVKPNDDRGELILPAPVFVTGTVGANATIVPSAVVRAWLPVVPDSKDSGNDAPQLVQIGETVTDAYGHFVLPLPPSLSFSASQGN